jgi:tRNA uridine 5-carboxymethylaminomethyl modification enzyme
MRPPSDGRWRSVLDLAGNETVAWPALCHSFPWLFDLSPRVTDQLRTDARYAGYLHRQQTELRLGQREDGVGLGDVKFEDIGGLSNEIREILNRTRPPSLGAASRIQGMTPAAVASIAAHLRKREILANADA